MRTFGIMNETDRLALDFVRSAKGGPTSAEFDATHSPLGPLLRPKLTNAGYLSLSGGRIHLTQAGTAALNAANSVV